MWIAANSSERLILQIHHFLTDGGCDEVQWAMDLTDEGGDDEGDDGEDDEGDADPWIDEINLADLS